MKNVRSESEIDCPCEVWGCPNRHDCEACVRSHREKGHLNACGFYTILPVIEKLISLVECEATKEVIRRMLIDPNAKAYALCRSMHDTMKLEDVVTFLNSPVDGLRCNAHESLKVRTGLDVDYNPMGASDEIVKGAERWKKALGLVK